jgi:uncharacterized protein (DUF1810 family)
MPQPDGLDRFRDAQDDRFSGFDPALREIQSGRKQSHWIWYVFPQLAGLGNSGLAKMYGIRDLAEAMNYLRDPVLRDRLQRITAAVAEQAARGVPVPRLMDSRIDALKLVSSLTLFESVARDLYEQEHEEKYRSLADTAAAVLDAAQAGGVTRCAYTLEALERSG